MKFEDMEKVVETKYDIDTLFAVLRFGSKNPSAVGIAGFINIYKDIIEGLFRKIEHDFHNSIVKKDNKVIDKTLFKQRT